MRAKKIYGPNREHHKHQEVRDTTSKKEKVKHSAYLPGGALRGDVDVVGNVL